MAKISAVLGFTFTEETDPVNRPNIWEKVVVEKTYKAEVIRNYKRIESSDKINDDFNISNQISILAPPFAHENLPNLTYIKFLNAKWKISGVDINYPRLILTLGGIYNEG